MSSFHMIELQIDVAALYRFLHLQGLIRRDEDAELGYGIHAWLGAAFGELAPKPWRLLMDTRRPPRILGYSSYDANALRRRIAEFAQPSVLQVCSEPQLMIASRVMPTWQEGRKLGFQALVCPVGRKARTGREMDVYWMQVGSDDTESRPRRDEVYSRWLEERLDGGAAAIDAVSLSGYKAMRQLRRGPRIDGERMLRSIVCPHVTLEGTLTVRDSGEFARLLARGIGRHRTFGYGMILLRPAGG